MILVTGGTGLTGQFVVAELLRRRHPVRVLCRPERAAIASASGAEVALGDLRDPQSLMRAAQGTTGIVHTACTYTDSSIDITAMQALLASWQAGKFVFISSLDVYGLTGAELVTEDAPLCETYNDYSRGKVVCERLLEQACSLGGREAVMLRAPYIFGPHPTARKRLVKQRLQDHQPIVLPGVDEAEWMQYRDVWIDVRDLATLVADCLSRPARGPLNVLTGHVTWHELYRELIRLTGSRSELIHKPLDAITEDELPNKHLYAQRWRFSEARLAAQLGELPRRLLAVTLRDTVMASAARHQPD